jgi:hypothetical protein
MGDSIDQFPRTHQEVQNIKIVYSKFCSKSKYILYNNAINNDNRKPTNGGDRASCVRCLSLKTRREVTRTCAESPAIVRLGLG